MESVLKTQNICTKDCLLKCEKEIQIENEFVLPDYCPPIKKVLTYKIEPAISSKNTSGNILNLDGVSGFKLIYIDDRDTLNSFEGAFVFSKNIECDFELDNTKISIESIYEKISYRVLSERKIELKGPIYLKIYIYNVKKQRCICSECSEDFEMLTSSMTLKDSVLFAEKNLIIEEEISLSDSHSKIGKIINYSGKILADECKVMNGKVMLKGFLLVSVTYLSAENFTAHHFEQKIPYSQVCDVDGINDVYKCKTDEKLVFLEVKCRNAGYEESHTMLINAKICVNVEAYNDITTDVVLDIYSTEHSVEVVSEPVRTEQLIDTINDSFTAKKVLEFSGGSIGSVIDIRSDVQMNGIKLIDNCISVYGIAYIKMIICDVNGNPEFCERAIDFEYKCKVDYNNENNEYNATLELSNISYVITSDCCIEIRCDIDICLEIYEIREANIITEVSVREEDLEPKNDCSVIISYVNEETDLWSIAKKYRSSVSEISALNGIEKNVKTVSGPIVIPVK